MKSTKGQPKKTSARTRVKDLPPKKASATKVSGGGSDQVGRPGCGLNHNETLLVDEVRQTP
ncbi:MAG TPA: hypothetical protein VGL09_05995 [Methylomirabilota bacterium]|jgi:hypothetical protein